MTRRKDTKIPQSSVPSDNVANKAVNEEMDDSLERAVTTATSLDVKQDRGSGPRCQNTIGDTIAQTRSENVSKQSNDSLLARVNTPRSDEDSLKLQELIELCTNLQKKVLDFETTNSSKYDCMFEKKARVESSSEEDLGKEDASKQGRIADIDNNEDITLVSTHFDADTDMFGVHDLDGEEVFVESEAPMVNAATITSTILVSAATIIEVDITLAQALAELKSVKPKAVTTAAITITTASTRPKAKGLDKVEADYQLAQRLKANEQEELTIEEKAKLFQKLLEKRRKHFAAKRVEEERKKPPTKAQQRIIIRGSKHLMGIPLLKPPTIVDWKILKEGKISYFQIIRADGSSMSPEEGYERVLWGDLKTMFEPHVEDTGRIVGDKSLLEVTTARYNELVDYGVG
ncbi:hypothetical protein Tco_0967344 [Tanacetum coccineum]